MRSHRYSDDFEADQIIRRRRLSIAWLVSSDVWMKCVDVCQGDGGCEEAKDGA